MNDNIESGATGLWMQMRRRKVVQWGLAYAAGAWGLLQGFGFAADAFEWPSAVKQLALLLLLIGLPIVVVLAWYHGDRGQQRVSGPEFAILAVLLLAGGGIFWWHQKASDLSSAATLPPRAAKPLVDASDKRPSIAVLPFENRSRLEDDAFFVDGVHDDILTQLTKIGAMRVIARTSVEQFRDTKLTTRQIAEKLGVTRVLEGGVQRAGDRVRITVQLIDAATDTHLWAESYDRELTVINIFAIQSEVATAIAAAMKTTLTSVEKSRVDAVPTQSLEAWEAYQLGQRRMASRNTENLVAAEKFFRKAIDLDRKFALAYVGLAAALSLQVDNSGVPRDVWLAKAEKAAATALQLDPNLAEAWAASGLIEGTKGDTRGDKKGHDNRAETMLRRAIELNPNYANAYMWLAGVVENDGRGDEAHSYTERAVALDPFSLIGNLNLGEALTAIGQFDEAEARYRKVIEIDPTMAKAYASIGALEAYARNRFANAFLFFQRAADLDPGNPGLRSNVWWLYYHLNDDIASARLLQELRTRWPDNDGVRWLSDVSAMARGDAVTARRAAEALLVHYPRSREVLWQLRDLDAQTGQFDAARRRYATAFPELLAKGSPRLDDATLDDAIEAVAVDLAYILQKTGESERAGALLDAAEARIRKKPRLGHLGYGILDVEIFAVRDQKAKALMALRAAQQAGWRGGWRYLRDFDANLASIRNEPEFKAVFADIERDMARQRAELAARPKGATLEL